MRLLAAIVISLIGCGAFLDERDGDSRGRPVGVALDGRGGLLVADDVGNVIWRVTAAHAGR
jgi:glucose/arabinose dehydrogenase